MSIQHAGKTRWAIGLAGFAVLCYSLSLAARASEPPTDAVAALSAMSKTLQAAHFSFQARTFRAYAGPNGELLHIAHGYKAILSRPDRLSVDLTGDDGATKLLYDGKKVVIYVVEQKKYASLAVPGGIDEALDAVQQRTGLDFPLADLFSSDPGDSLLTGVTSGGQVGMATIDGVTCRHFFFTQASDDLEWELWLEDNERALPRRVVVTYRSLPGRPNFIAELANWDFSSAPPDSEFTFTPPAGVTEVPFATRPSATQGSQK